MGANVRKKKSFREKISKKIRFFNFYFLPLLLKNLKTSNYDKYRRKTNTCSIAGNA